MLFTVITKDKRLHRTVTRINIKKVAKSIHKEFPNSDYAALYAFIWNGIQKDMKSLTIRAKDL